MPRPTNSAVRLRRGQRVLIDKLEATLAEGFQKSCQQICDDVILRQLTEAIAKGNIERVLLALDIDAAGFRPYTAALENAWEAGGTLAANTMPLLVKRNA